MTLPTNEGNPPVSGTPEANPPVSDTKGQPLPANFEALQRRLDAVEAQNRALQSDKDRRIPQLQEQIKKIASHLNITDEELIKRATRETLLDNLLEERTALPADSGKPSQAPRFQVSSIASELKLDLNDPDVITAIRPDMNEAQIALALGKVAVAKSLKPSLTDAQLPTPNTPPPPPPPKKTLADLQKEYDAEVIRFRGNIQKVSDVQAKYRKLGLRV